MRRVPRLALASLLSLPPAGSALVAFEVEPFAAWLHKLVASVPPGSLAGKAFYASFEPLIPVFGANALAAHAFILASPFLAASAAVFILPATRRPARS